MRLTRFGYPAAAVTETGLLLADGLLSMARGDALVVLAYGQVTRETDATLSRAQQVGARVVLLRDALGAALADTVPPRLASGFIQRVDYVRIAHGRQTVVTGTPRDAIGWIENGRIVAPAAVVAAFPVD